MPSSFKRRILSRRMRWSRLLLLGPSPQSLLSIQLLSHPVVMDRLFFLPQHPFPQLLLLLPLCLHHPFKTLLMIFHYFIPPSILLRVLPPFPFLVLLPILIFCLPLLHIPLQTNLFSLHPVL